MLKKSAVLIKERWHHTFCWLKKFGGEKKGHPFVTSHGGIDAFSEHKGTSQTRFKSTSSTRLILLLDGWIDERLNWWRDGLIKRWISSRCAWNVAKALGETPAHYVPGCSHSNVPSPTWWNEILTSSSTIFFFFLARSQKKSAHENSIKSFLNDVSLGMTNNKGGFFFSLSLFSIRSILSLAQQNRSKLRQRQRDD